MVRAHVPQARGRGAETEAEGFDDAAWAERTAGPALAAAVEAVEAATADLATSAAAAVPRASLVAACCELAELFLAAEVPDPGRALRQLARMAAFAAAAEGGEDGAAAALPRRLHRRARACRIAARALLDGADAAEDEDEDGDDDAEGAALLRLERSRADPTGATVLAVLAADALASIGVGGGRAGLLPPASRAALEHGAAPAEAAAGHRAAVGLLNAVRAAWDAGQPGRLLPALHRAGPGGEVPGAALAAVVALLARAVEAGEEGGVGTGKREEAVAMARLLAAHVHGQPHYTGEVRAALRRLTVDDAADEADADGAVDAGGGEDDAPMAEAEAEGVSTSSPLVECFRRLQAGAPADDALEAEGLAGVWLAAFARGRVRVEGGPVAKEVPEGFWEGMAAPAPRVFARVLAEQVDEASAEAGARLVDLQDRVVRAFMPVVPAGTCQHWYLGATALARRCLDVVRSFPQACEDEAEDGPERERRALKAAESCMALWLGREELEWSTATAGGPPAGGPAAPDPGRYLTQLELLLRGLRSRAALEPLAAALAALYNATAGPAAAGALPPLLVGASSGVDGGALAADLRGRLGGGDGEAAAAPAERALLLRATRAAFAGAAAAAEEEEGEGARAADRGREWQLALGDAAAEEGRWDAGLGLYLRALAAGPGGLRDPRAASARLLASGRAPRMAECCEALGLRAASAALLGCGEVRRPFVRVPSPRPASSTAPLTQGLTPATHRFAPGPRRPTRAGAGLRGGGPGAVRRPASVHPAGRAVPGVPLGPARARGPLRARRGRRPGPGRGAQPGRAAPVHDPADPAPVPEPLPAPPGPGARPARPAPAPPAAARRPPRGGGPRGGAAALGGPAPARRGDAAIF